MDIVFRGMTNVVIALAITLIATVGLASSAMADTVAGLQFQLRQLLRHNGLSQPYAGPTTTGQSYGTSVAIRPSDPIRRSTPWWRLRQCRCRWVGAPSRQAAARYRLAPRRPVTWGRTPSCDAPAMANRRPFGDNGYVSAFPTSNNTNYKFTSICIDPGTGHIVVVGQETLPAARRRRRAPGAAGSWLRDRVPGHQFQSPVAQSPGDSHYRHAQRQQCSRPVRLFVVDDGAGHSGAILVGGVDGSRPSSSLVLTDKISSSGSF